MVKKKEIGTEMSWVNLAPYIEFHTISPIGFYFKDRKVFRQMTNEIINQNGKLLI